MEELLTKNLHLLIQSLIQNVQEENKDSKEDSRSENYEFRHLSDYPLLEEDKKILHDEKKRDDVSFTRSLRIALSKKLPGAKLNTIICKIEDNIFLNTVVEYEKNNITRVIDYEKNLIMKKDDYDKKYQVLEIQSLLQSDLYHLMKYVKRAKGELNIFLIILFGNEILRNNNFKVGKFDSSGMNTGNYFIFEDTQSYSLFDYQLSPMDKEIQEFTQNPEKFTKHIFYSEKKDCYFYKEIPFRLLSDTITNPKVKNILLSDNRYQECHANSLKLLFCLDHVKLVNGKVRRNQHEMFFHSWVEDDTFVYDFNRNLIMKKEDYYKMVDASKISINNKEEMSENIQLLEEARIILHSSTLGYFREELHHDLVKNKHLFKQLVKQTNSSN